MTTRLNLQLMTSGVAKYYGALPSDILHLSASDLSWNLSSMKIATAYEDLASRKDSKGRPLLGSPEVVFAELLAQYQSPAAQTDRIAKAHQDLREARMRGTVG